MPEVKHTDLKLWSRGVSYKGNLAAFVFLGYCASSLYCLTNFIILFFLYSCIKFHCVHGPCFLCLFICCWDSRLVQFFVSRIVTSMVVQVSLWRADSEAARYIPRSGVAGSHGSISVRIYSGCTSSYFGSTGVLISTHILGTICCHLLSWCWPLWQMNVR